MGTRSRWYSCEIFAIGRSSSEAINSKKNCSGDSYTVPTVSVILQYSLLATLLPVKSPVKSQDSLLQCVQEYLCQKYRASVKYFTDHLCDLDFSVKYIHICSVYIYIYIRL